MDPRELDQKQREEDRRRERLYKEYAEAGSLCRSYETHSRTSVSTFLPFATAVLVLAPNAGHGTRLQLYCASVVIALFTLSTLLRVAFLYQAYVTRAREIEGSLEMSVYSRWDAAYPQWVRRLTLPHKWAMCGVVFLALVAFAWKLCEEARSPGALVFPEF